MKLNWVVKKFDELTLQELYAILQFRNKVFIVEQTCPFQDMDNKDDYSHHIIGYKNNEIMAYSRILPPGTAYEQASIGRVATDTENRRFGYGRELMQHSIEILTQLHGEVPIKIGAQLYLKQFYESFGFIQYSDMYMEDGIPHIEMLKSEV